MIDSLAVLYVEDCEGSVELLRLCLKKHCPDTEIYLDVTATVSEAVNKFSATKHVAALIDWNLPDGQGTDVAQHIRQLHKTLPIIFLSASFAEKHLLEAKQYGPGDCLTKGHDRNFIDSIVQHISKDIC